MCKYMSIISRIIRAVSIILGIIGKKKKRNSRKHNRKILKHNRLKPIVVFIPFVSTSACTFTEGSSLALLDVHELVQWYSGHLNSPVN